MKRLMLTVAIGLSATTLHAQAVKRPWTFSYGGQLVDKVGNAVAGPVLLELKFYKQASGGDAIGVQPVSFPNVPLNNGEFQVDATMLTDAELDLLFKGDTATWVEVVANGKAYFRQQIVAVPYALRVPTNNKRVKFDADTNRLTVGPAADAAAGQFLTVDANGEWTWATPASAPASSISTKPVDMTAPANGQILKYDGSTDSWKASPVLPAVAADANKFLKYNGSTFVWDTPSGAGDMAAATWDVDANGRIDVAKGGTNQSSVAANAFFVGPLDAAGAPSFRALDPADIPADAIGNSHLANDAVGPAELAANAVTLAKIANTDANCATAGNVLKVSGGVWTCSPDANSGGTVTSVAAGTGLTGATITSSGALAVDVGAAANKIPQFNAYAQLPLTNGTAALPALTFSGDADTGLAHPADNVLTFSTAGNERVRINDAGEVGIGTNSPAAKLHVVGNTGSFKYVDTTQGAGKVLTSDANGVATWQTPSPPNLASPGPIGSMTPSTGAFSSVGVGTISPDAPFHVTRMSSGVSAVIENASSTAGDGALLEFRSKETAGSVEPRAALKAIQGSAAAKGHLVLETANGGAPSERLRVREDGNVGIGNINPTERLVVNGRIKSTDGYAVTSVAPTKQGGIIAGSVQTGSGAACNNGDTVRVGFTATFSTGLNTCDITFSPSFATVGTSDGNVVCTCSIKNGPGSCEISNPNENGGTLKTYNATGTAAGNLWASFICFGPR